MKRDFYPTANVKHNNTVALTADLTSARTCNAAGIHNMQSRALFIYIGLTAFRNNEIFRIVGMTEKRNIGASGARGGDKHGMTATCYLMAVTVTHKNPHALYIQRSVRAVVAVTEAPIAVALNPNECLPRIERTDPLHVIFAVPQMQNVLSVGMNTVDYILHIPTLAVRIGENKNFRFFRH